jgi:hypothetical protein
MNDLSASSQRSLRDVIAGYAAAHSLSLGDLTVMAPQTDPFASIHPATGATRNGSRTPG